jgi:hypothetical protein
MWDEEAALDLRRKAQDYLREYEPEGYERSERAAVAALRIREDMRLAYYWHDAGLHKKAVDEMVVNTLEDYARWLKEWRAGVH